MVSSPTKWVSGNLYSQSHCLRILLKHMIFGAHSLSLRQRRRCTIVQLAAGTYTVRASVKRRCLIGETSRIVRRWGSSGVRKRSLAVIIRTLLSMCWLQVINCYVLLLFIFLWRFWLEKSGYSTWRSAILSTSNLKVAVYDTWRGSEHHELV